MRNQTFNSYLNDDPSTGTSNNANMIQLMEASASCTLCKKDFCDEESLRTHILDFHSDQLSNRDNESFRSSINDESPKSTPRTAHNEDCSSSTGDRSPNFIDFESINDRYHTMDNLGQSLEHSDYNAPSNTITDDILYRKDLINEDFKNSYIRNSMDINPMKSVHDNFINNSSDYHNSHRALSILSNAAAMRQHYSDVTEMAAINLVVNEGAADLSIRDGLSSTTPTTNNDSLLNGQSHHSSMTHHQGKLSERVVCDICNKQVCNKYFLKTHKSRVHGVVIDNSTPIKIEEKPIVNTHSSRKSSTASKYTANNQIRHCVSGGGAGGVGGLSGLAFTKDRLFNDSSEKSPLSSSTLSVDNLIGQTNNNVDNDWLMECTDKTPRPSASTSTDSQQQQQQMTSGKAQCNICNKEFCSVYFLKNHQQNVHQIQNPVITSTTNTFFSSSSENGTKNLNLVGENEIINNQMISKVSDANKSTKKEQWPKSKSQSPAQTRVTCKVCHKELCNKYFLRSHMMNVHNIFGENATPIAKRPPDQQKPNNNHSTSPQRLSMTNDQNAALADLKKQENDSTELNNNNNDFSKLNNFDCNSDKGVGGGGQFKCPLCGDQMNTDEECNEHWTKVHGRSETSSIAPKRDSSHFENTSEYNNDVMSSLISADGFVDRFDPPKCKGSRVDIPGFSGMQPFIFESEDSQFIEHFIPCMVYLPIKTHVNSVVNLNLRLKPVKHDNSSRHAKSS